MSRGFSAESITEGATITLSAVDQVSNGVSSALKDIFFLVDVNPKNCQGESDFTGPGGTCRNPRYTEPFSLSGGTHTVYYSAVDNVGNEAAVKSALITVSPVNSNMNIVPPVTTFVFWEPHFGVDPVYVSSRTGIFLYASDNLSGAATTYYSVDSDTFSVYAGMFTIVGEGAHLVRYYSADTAGNSEAVKISSITVDDTPPAVLPDITGPLYELNGVSYVSSLSTVTLKASDAASGLKELYYKLNGSAYSVLADSQVFTLAEGVYMLAYRATDNLGNAGEISISSVTVDTSAPASVYVLSGSTVNIASSDALSGVKEIYYALDGSTGVAPSPVSMVPGPGWHTLAFHAVDNVGNIEAEALVNFTIDRTAPALPLDVYVDSAPFGSPSPWKNTREYTLTWTNPPDASGVAGVRVKFGAARPVSNDEGTFYPADGSLNYSAPDAINGANPIWLWLEDNVGSADHSTAVELSLRYDDTAPVSVTSSTGGTTAAVIPVAFNSTDPDPGSGPKETVLWRRTNSVAWSSGSYILSGSSGTFNFNTWGAQGLWEFYTQAFDNAGNSEPSPVSTTPAKTSTYFDPTPPAIFNVSVTEITPGTARITWETDDETTGTVSYGVPSPALEFKDCTYSARHSVLVDGLVYPANYAFAITAANRAGSQVEYTGGSFYVPPRINAGIDYFGVLNVNQPIVIEVTNPLISSITYTFDGQTVTQAVTPFVPLEIYAPAGMNQASLSLNLDGFTYSTSFIVDTATRTVFLARVVISAGGLMSDIEPGKSTVDMTAGQEMQGEVSGGQSKLFLGYYAGIDPVAPGAVNNLSAVSGPASGQAALSWTAPGDDGNAGTAMKYDIRWSTSPVNSSNFEAAFMAGNIPFPQKAGTVQQTTVSGLNRLTTYYFSLRSYDELNNASALSNTAVLFNGHVLTSTVTVNGVPEISFLSPVPPVVTLVSAASAAGTVAIGSAAAGGLTLAGNLYEIGPEGFFDPPAVLMFYYSTSTLAALGLLETDIAIYEYSAVWGWIKLPDQTLDPENRRITTPISRIASLFGIFGVVKDRSAPVTEYRAEGMEYRTGDGRLYINAASSVALTAYDPIVYGTATGVAFTEYRVDPDTAAPFALYASPFTLSTGPHTVEFRSQDNAANLEIAKSSAVFADGEPPLTEFSLAGASFAADGTLYAAPGSTVTLVSFDTASGVKALYYSLNSATSIALSGHAETMLPGEGDYLFGYYAIDNVNNAEAETSRLVRVDTTPPAITISSPAAGEIFIATRNKLDVGFDVKDNFDPAPKAEAFLVQTEDRGSPRSGRFDKIAVINGQVMEPLAIDDGIWRLIVSATDFALNSTTAVSGLFEVVHDTLAPRAVLEARGERIGDSVYVTARTMFTLTGIDDLVQAGDGIGLGVKKQKIEIRGQMSEVRELTFENPAPRQGEAFVSTFTLAKMADGIYGLAYNAEDIIGNIGEVRISTYAVDNTAPQTGYRVEGIGYSKDGILYIARESGIYLETVDPVINGVASGLKAVYYQVDDQAFSLYISSFTLTEGIHHVAFYAVDNLNNAENLKTVTLLVDDTPPTTSLVPGGNYYIPLSGRHVGDFYAPAWFAYKLSAYDPVIKDVSSGLAVSEYRITALDHFDTEPIDPSPQDLGKPFTLFNYNIPNNSFALAEGIQRVDYRSRDNVLNLELAKTSTIFVDATPPVSRLMVSSLACCSRSDGLIVNSISPLTVHAEDLVIKGVASGPALSYFIENGVNIMTRDYVKDQTAYYHVPASYGDGPVNLTVFSVDSAGNNEIPFNARVVLDNTPPAALIISPASSIENPGLCKLVGGTEVKVIGSVTDRGQKSEIGSQNLVEFDHFQSYTLEFGYGAAPASYTLIASSSPGAGLENAVLGVWDTAGLPEGVYTLKLTAKDCVGNEAFTTAQVIISQPKLLLSLGSRGNGKGEFNSPSYIAVDPADGNFWVSDTNNDRLQKFTSSGTHIMGISSWGGEDKGKGKGHKPAESFNKPQGIAVDSAGNLWLADGNNDRALKFSATGQFLLELKAGFNKPHGLALDAQNNLYVADRNNDRVLKFSPQGELLLTINTGIGADLNKPVGVLAVDRQGRLYVSDRNNDRVLVYDSSGTFLRQLGEGSDSGPGQFNKPDGIAVNALAYAFVADTNNSRVQKFDPYGNLVMVFDRASNDAEPFNHPGGLAVDAEGNLFVVDSNNAKVKKFGAEGELVRIASQEDSGQPQGAAGASASRLVARAVGGKVHHPKGITVDIPAGALNSDAEITITAGHKAEGSGYRAQGAGRGKKLASITEAVEFGPDGAIFDKPLTISIPYNPSRLAAGVSETELAICRFNQSSNAWEELPSVVDTRLKVVSAETTHFSLYTVMAPVVGGAEFALGEVYVFPNPAKGAQVPTFHIEAGMADKVTIKIYTVSGRLAHETTLSGLPQIIDDGHGSEYAYEYAWSGHIPSGIYYYYIEAEKARQKLKKTGKFAVVR